MVFWNLDLIRVCGKFDLDKSFARLKVEVLADERSEVEHEIEVKFFGVPNSCPVVVRPGVVNFLDVMQIYHKIILVLNTNASAYLEKSVEKLILVPHKFDQLILNNLQHDV